MFCWKCGTELEIESNEVYRTAECPVCGSDLHCCKCCKFYDEGSHFDCRESIYDPVSDKERANFCEYYSPSEEQPNISSSEDSQDARNALDALFGGE